MFLEGHASGRRWPGAPIDDTYWMWRRLIGRPRGAGDEQEAPAATPEPESKKRTKFDDLVDVFAPRRRDQGFG
jgi:hypothetical protein